MEIETERLILRQWRDGDADPLAAMNADPEVMRYFASGPLCRIESDAMLGQLRRKWRAPGVCYFAVEAKDGGFIGFVGLNRPMFEAQFTPCLEIAWRLVRHARGQGYATEAARVCLDWGFGEMGLDEIVSFAVVANARSRAVMERLGMRHDAAGDFDHPTLPVDSSFRRHVLYRLKREEWRA